MHRIRTFSLACLALSAALLPLPLAAQTAGTMEKGSFKFDYDARGISGLSNPNDPFGAVIVPSSRGGGAGGRRGGGGGGNAAAAGQATDGTSTTAARGGRGGRGRRGAAAAAGAAATSETLPGAAAAIAGTAAAAGGGQARGRGRGGAGGAASAGTNTINLSVTARPESSGPNDWAPVETRALAWNADPAAGTITYTNQLPDGPLPPLAVHETFKTDGKVLDWTVALEATKDPMIVGNLGISVPIQGPNGQTPADIFERGFTAHQFIEGNSSYVYYTRASGAPPFLLVSTRPDTKLEYTGSGGRGGGAMYVHSKVAADSVTVGTWRQPNTTLKLAAAGQQGSKVEYGFRIQWASSYDEIRDLLYKDGLIDIRVVPGMTVPSDLNAKFSLHTKAKIDSVQPEFPDKTKITDLGITQDDTHVYEVAFQKLGENKVTVHHDGTHETHLEFFVTEPMETLIKKRAAFLVEKQQIKDPSKWWNGVYGPYDMIAKKTRTIDDPDIFLDRMVYVLTCDDIGLAKPPYIAEKNVFFPDQKEIDSLEYYIKNFVWGGLQRKDDERPYPYGIYGTPNWYIDRDPGRRKAYAEALANGGTAITDLNKEHIWRSYDYPHVIMLYYHMYQIAKLYPNMSHYLDAKGYLERAYQTARAFYIYPYEIYPNYYESMKWGLYNELTVVNVMDALKAEGFPEQADWLRQQWELKVKYFVYDDPYPFRSEYAFDRTAFESTYALAKYGATHDMQPDEKLWKDIKAWESKPSVEKWYSHPSVKREDSLAFMDRQLASGLCVRGWLNPAYYTLGCDPGVSYMAAMGGWGVLDYALNFAPKPYDWLQLGYASYLSSWCLMNTGTAESNYGAWFPGKENDGAAGWQFQSSKAGGAFMYSSSGIQNPQEPRGPWHYDGEIDLGFGGALRSAATVVTNDPTFGWFTYGGAMSVKGEDLTISPRDGLRRRFSVVIPDMYLPFSQDVKRLKFEIDKDGFAPSDSITMDKRLSKVAFTLENRTSDAHTTGVKLSIPLNMKFDLMQDGKKVELSQTGDWDFPWSATLNIPATGGTKLELVRTDLPQPGGRRGRGAAAN